MKQNKNQNKDEQENTPPGLKENWQNDLDLMKKHYFYLVFERI